MVVGKLSWTKFFFIGCLFLLLFTVNLAAQKQSPKIAFDKTSIDLGQIAPGEKAAGVFIVSNKGSDTLKIQRVAPTWGCTVAKFDKVIPPGQTGKITATMDSKKYSGKQNKPIVVVSNDPDNPKASITLSCNILGVHILPASRVYFNTYSGNSQTKVVTISTLGDGPITAHAIASKPNIGLRVEKTGEPKPADPNEYWTQYRLFITIPENYPLGRFAESVTVATNSEYSATSEIRIAGAVNPDLVVSPSTIRLNSAGGKKLPKRIIKLTKKIGEDFKVTKVISNPAQVKTRLEETKKGRQFAIHVNWAENKKGKFNGKIVIHTNDKKKPVINVPVHVSIK